MEGNFPSSDLGHTSLSLFSPSLCSLEILRWVTFEQEGLPEWRSWHPLTSLLLDVLRGQQGP